MSLPIPDFNQTEYAFKYKSNQALNLTHFVFKLFNYPTLVKLLSNGAEWILKYKLPGKILIKQSVFKVFCAGENLKQAFVTINHLSDYKVKSVLDYVSENEQNAAGYQANVKRIKENIITLSKNYPGHYISIKITGLEDYAFLKSINNPFKERTDHENERLEKLFKHIDEICHTASTHNISIYFDAEERCTQDIYDYIVEQMMEKYNTQKAIIYNTLQMYLTDRNAYLYNLTEHCKAKKYYAGVKIVRGAYHEKENEIAAREGIPSPVYQTKKETDESFNKAINICLHNFEYTYLCIASHNEESILHAIHQINTIGIKDAQQKLSFSQLFGMSDNLTFNLARCGYEVSKYLPYGEIEKAIPYLIRRANENKSVNGQVTRELQLLNTEIERRKKHA